MSSVQCAHSNESFRFDWNVLKCAVPATLCEEWRQRLRLKAKVLVFGDLCWWLAVHQSLAPGEAAATGGGVVTVRQTQCETLGGVT